jgi:mannose-6-phosphate isomerase-like protein (cupin superfamily)
MAAVKESKLALVVMAGMLAAASVLAQAPAAAHEPRGSATDVPNADIEATLAKTASATVSDQAIRVVSVNNEYNVGVGVVHRSKTAAGQPGNANAVEHSQITEVYHFIRGTGTFVTGGTIENARDVAPESNVVKVLNGPSTSGGAVQGGVSRKVGPGDAVIIPPNTPHWFSEIASPEIVYLVVRVDPKKVLPAGYGAK